MNKMKSIKLNNIKINKLLRLSVLILFIGISTIILTGCEFVDNVSSIKWECSRESIDSNGYKTIDKLTIKIRDQYVKYIDSETLYEVDANYLDKALEYGNSLSDAVKNCNGVKLKYEKYDDTTLRIVTKINYEQVNETQLRNALGTNYSETDPLLSGKQVEFSTYKAITLKDYVCK